MLYGLIDFAFTSYLNKIVKVNPTHRVFSRSPRKYDDILQEIFILLEVSMRKSNGDFNRLKSIFQEEVEKWVAVK